MAEDVKGRSEETCQAGEEFVKLFYDTFDKRRHLISKFFLDSAYYTWNGNAATGSAEILKFCENLPTSEHTVESFDAQPILSELSPGQTSVMVSVSGSVKYEKSKAKWFNENFILTEQDHTWKIVSDCLRTTN